jgi:hypothetical protein
MCQFIVNYNVYEKIDYIIDKLKKNNYYRNDYFVIYKRNAYEKINNNKVIYFDYNYNLYTKYSLFCVKQYYIDVISYSCFCKIKSFTIYSDYNTVG